MRFKPSKPPPVPVLLPTRGYQQEMLEESLVKNIVIALDTGSGKTHIAVLRMKHECEHQQDKLSWFLAPTVSLCRQQRRVIATALPVSVGLISGADEPDQWKDARLWRTVLSTHRIMVTTPQVLLDALRHGYIDLGRDISLLVFDEAHHAVDNNPYNQIMKEFYFRIPPSETTAPDTNTTGQWTRPKILGLTASPVYGGDIAEAFHELEANLDCTIRAPLLHREELGGFVHRPTLKHIFYTSPYDLARPFSANLTSLESVVDSLEIEDDPYVKSLRHQLGQLPPGPERSRVDQRLSKTILKNNSYTHKGLLDFARTASEICEDVGPWAADWYIQKVLERAKATSGPYQNFFNSWRNSEKVYLLEVLNRVTVTPVSYDPQDIVNGTTAKVQALVDCLEAEKADVEEYDEAYSGLIFVTRRDTVLALAEVLSRHPRTANAFSVGCLLGVSESARRHAFLDVTRTLTSQSHEDTLEDFKQGEKNLIVSTSVAEEGIDIQACGSVIRWNVPANMVSWAQSRGRARRKRSTYTIMFEEGGVHAADISKWEALERKMMDLYNDEHRPARGLISEDLDYTGDDEDVSFRVESTGALLTLQSAIPHLYHFCSVIPNASLVPYTPIFDIDPPDLPPGWHSFESRFLQTPPLYPGPWTSTVTLPRVLPPHLQVFSTDKMYSTKTAAHQHVAFKAYLALYENGLLSEHLLPLTDDMKPELDEEVKALLKDIEKRHGMAGVSCQMDPWAPSLPSEAWFASELVIDGLPSLLMFTLSQPMALSREEGPTLYRPDCHPIKVEWRVRADIVPSDDVINRARQYTRRLFWCHSGNRMKWEELHFAYLFLPTQEDVDQSRWDTRRAWLTKRNIQSGRPNADGVIANAAAFGTQFSFPTDLTLVNGGPSQAKMGHFVRWKLDAASQEEEEYLRKLYARIPDLEIAPPFLVVHPVAKRASLLHPPPSQPIAPSAKPEVLLIASLSTIPLLPNLDTQYAFLLPSTLRSLSNAMTTHSLRKSLLMNNSLSMIPLELLITATTAPVSQERSNYQRLETLGDTVLKFIAGVQLLAEYPLWHEGYLTKRKDHSVANVRLAKEAFRNGLHRWIIRDRLLVRKWKPAYRLIDDIDVKMKEVSSQDPPSPKKPKVSQELSTKILADVVESLIGAAYLQGSYDLGIECARVFDLGIPWQMLSQRIQAILDRTEHVKVNHISKQIPDVERMLGYEFEHKLLLIEALTHASHHQAVYTTSYERMEFLGDSVLDMVVTDMLYRAPGKKYSPGHMHLRKSAVVNSHFLAYICLGCATTLDATMPKVADRGRIDLAADDQRVYLWQCLLHSSPRILEDQSNTFARHKRSQAEIEMALQTDSMFPWATLTRLQAPKFFSDIVESVIGAVYLDSRGDFDVVRKLLRTLGILPVLERIIKDDVDVLHPVSRLSLWASKNDKKLEYKFEKEKGRVTCVVLLDGIEEVRVGELHRGRASQEEVKFQASDEAIKKLRLRGRFDISRKKKKATCTTTT